MGTFQIYFADAIFPKTKTHFEKIFYRLEDLEEKAGEENNFF